MRRILFLTVILLTLPIAAQAQTVNGIDLLLARFQAAMAGWSGPLQVIMLGTFGVLALIDLVWFVGYRTLMSKGDLGDLIHGLVGWIVFEGFFLWLLTTFNTTGPLIIQGFRLAAQQSGGIAMSPNGIFAEGMTIASAITHQVSILHPADSAGLIICGLVVLGCFAWIVGSIVIVLVESYFIVTAGQIMLMFGGSRFTYDKAVNLLWTCVGIGLKIYVLQLIAAVGTAFIAGWVNAPVAVSFDNIFIEIGEVLILAVITGGIPHMFERLASHISTSSAGGLLAAAGGLTAAATAIGRAVVKAATAAAGTGAAAGSAARLASTQQSISQAAGTGPSTAAGRAASMIGSTAANMVSAKATDIGRGLRGQRGGAGQSSWRMSTDLNERNRLLREGQNGP